jgi:YbbR domain-containing protein
MLFIRWFGRNIGTFLLAFGLALVVWISAETAADPNVEQVFPRPVRLEITNEDPNLLIISEVPEQVRISLAAPSSKWAELQSYEQPLRAWIDLEGLVPGEHVVPVQMQVRVPVSPVRILQRTPAEVQVVLEPRITRTFPVNVVVEGEPFIGYQTGTLTYTPQEITIAGPESSVAQVVEVRSYLDITGAHQSIEATLPVQALNASGEPVVEDISISPILINATQPITLLGGYRNMIVSPTFTGTLAEGYRLTNISVSPPGVVVFSSDLELLTNLPGYIETVPFDLTGIDDDVQAFVELDIPVGIEVPNDQRVLVQVGVAPIESTMALSLPVEVVGLPRPLIAQISPATVDVIISGPLPVLNSLKPSDIRVMVDLAGRSPGTYTLNPTVPFLPERVQLESVLPATLEVTISELPTPTPTSVPTPSLTPTANP